MDGFGFFVWRLQDLPVDPGKLLRDLDGLGVSWLSFKVADGANAFNQINEYGKVCGNDAWQKIYYGELQKAGIKVRGWHWPYPQNPGPCGDRAEERREKLNLDGYDLDIENEWADTKIYGRAKAAEVFLSKLHGGNFDISLCSYRFPTNFPAVPWNKFLSSDKVDFMLPQMYWQESHNVAEQINRSLAEYRAMTDKPVVMLGSMYGVGAPGHSGFWEPTCDDYKVFAASCKRLGMKAYGFYALDYVYREKRFEWLDALEFDDVEPEPPTTGDTTFTEFKITTDRLNKRENPWVGARVLGSLKKGEVVPATNIRGTDAWIQLPDKSWVCVVQGKTRFAEPAE